MIRVESSGVSSSSDHFEIVLSDGNVSGLLCIDGRALFSLRGDPVGVARLFAKELADTLQRMSELGGT